MCLLGPKRKRSFVIIFGSNMSILISFFVLPGLGLFACESDPCLNGATCNEFNSFYVCTCPLGYTGNNCEIGMITFTYLWCCFTQVLKKISFKRDRRSRTLQNIKSFEPRFYIYFYCSMCIIYFHGICTLNYVFGAIQLKILDISLTFKSRKMIYCYVILDGIF